MHLCYDGADGNGLHSYSDSSIGDNTEDCHSTSSYIFLLANGMTSWSSPKQKTIAQSTSEAEYMALANVANQAVWYCGFLRELGYTVKDAVPLHSDNKGAVDLALNPVTGHQSKPIDIKHHVIHKYIEDGQISLICTPTEEMVVDSFIKLLLCTLLLHFNPDMGLCAL